LSINRLPSPVIVLTFVLGVFFFVATVGSFHPGVVKDRYNEQFLPLMAHFFGEGTGATVLAARLSQFIIGAVELAGGVLMLWGVFDERNRVPVLKAGYGLMISLFGAFMITLFYLHDYGLPNWNQFPAILAMLLLAWVVVEREAKRGTTD
jgi:hypothetical protein